MSYKPPQIGADPSSYWDGIILNQDKIQESVKFRYDNMANILIGESVVVVISSVAHMRFLHLGLLMKAVVSSNPGLGVIRLDNL